MLAQSSWQDRGLAHWADFQTAIQLVAGLNIALYGLPDLREPGIAREQLAEEAVIAAANQLGQFEAAVRFRDQFQRNWGRLFEGFAAARTFCLIMSALTTLVLIRASGDAAAAEVTDQQFAWGSIVAGFLPAAWLLALNLRSRAKLTAAASLRRAMEQELTTVPQTKTPSGTH